MVKTVDFGPSFEGDLARVAAEAKEQAAPREGEPLPPREAVKSSLQALADRTSDEPPETEPDVHASAAELPDYLAGADVPQAERDEVEALVHLAFRAGLVKALGAARRRSPAVEDAFHDALTDKLLPELRARGLFA